LIVELNAKVRVVPPRVDEPVKCDEGLLKGQIADPDHIDGARVYPSRHVSYALG
jgi:hypothetical protein